MDLWISYYIRYNFMEIYFLNQNLKLLELKISVI